MILKENNSLKNKVEFNSKENTFVPHANITSSNIDKIEICILKSKIDCLGSTLNQCTFDHKRLKFLFQKKQVSDIHAHTLRHAHTHHTHMYANVYHCSHCDRKGQLAKFCFDSLKFSNANV